MALPHFDPLVRRATLKHDGNQWTLSVFDAHGRYLAEHHEAELPSLVRKGREHLSARQMTEALETVARAYDETSDVHRQAKEAIRELGS